MIDDRTDLEKDYDALAARLAEAERDAARYRFIKQWARRLDITGYSLTNNEHFEPRIDEAMQLRPADSAPAAPAYQLDQQEEGASDRKSFGELSGQRVLPATVSAEGSQHGRD